MSNQAAGRSRSGGQFNPADYVPVADRLRKFYEDHPKGRVITSIIEHDVERGFILMRAEIYREPDDAFPSATGHAYEIKTDGYVQKNSYIEVGETSSVGRALALLGYEIKGGIASRDDMQRVANREAAQRATQPPAQPQTRTEPEWACTPEQKVRIKAAWNTLISERGVTSERIKTVIKDNYSTDNVRSLDSAMAELFLADLDALLKENPVTTKTDS